MAIRLVESFDWCTTSTDLHGRYSVIDFNSSIAVGSGRFGGNAWSFGSTANESLQVHGGPFGPRIVVGFAFNSSNPLANFAVIELWDGLFNHGGTAQVTLAINAAGKLEARSGNNGATIAGPGPLVLQPNTYYYIECDILIAAANAGSFSCQVDGVSQFNVAGITTQQSAASQMTHFMCLGAGNPALFDDMYLKDTAGFLNPCRVILKKPNANGATNQWTATPGPNNFAMVNEVPADGDTTFNVDATAGDIDLYGFTALGQNPASIFAVQVSLFARKDDAAARTIATMVRSGGANFTGVTQPALTTSYLDFYLQIYEQDPNTAAAWLLAALDAAQFGVKTIS